MGQGRCGGGMHLMTFLHLPSKQAGAGTGSHGDSLESEAYCNTIERVLEFR